MARVLLNPPTPGWSLVIRPRDWATLSEHLFAEWGEHGAALLAECTDGPRGPRLLVRQVILATEGIDYVPGTTGFMALTAEFVRDCVSRAHDEGLVYIPVHNHGHLIALGVEVVYLEPYAKSRTVEMYGKVNTRFWPFTGVAPRRYASWFLYGRSSDRKDKLGVGISWSEEDRKTVAPLVTTQITTEAKAALEDWAVSAKPSSQDAGPAVESTSRLDGAEAGDS